MIPKLKNHSNPPPGLFAYIQTDGLTHVFKNNASIETLAKEVSAFRLKNRLQRGSLAECFQDIDYFNCVRLNHNSDWVFLNEVQFETLHASHPFIKQSCATCGQPIKTN